MRHCERSEAIHSAHVAKWIASSQGLLAMTGKQLYFMGYMSSQLPPDKVRVAQIDWCDGIDWLAIPPERRAQLIAACSTAQTRSRALSHPEAQASLSKSQVHSERPFRPIAGRCG